MLHLKRIYFHIVTRGILCLNFTISTQYDLTSMFNDTFWYLDGVFTIDNPEFSKYNVYPTELQLNRTNGSDKETSFLDLEINVIDSNIHTSVYDKRNDFGLIDDVHRLSAVFIFCKWLDLLDVVLTFWISTKQVVKSLENYWHMDIDITSVEKHFERS